MRRIQILLQIAVFLVLVMGTGFLSLYKLYDFEVNDRLDYNEWTADLGSRLETDIASSFPMKLTFVNINGLMRHLFGQREMNYVVRLNNGNLTREHPYTADETLARYADQVAKVKAFCDANGKHLLYIAAPYATCRFDDEFPAGFTEYSGDNAARFAALLKERGIDHIELCEKMHEDGLDHYEMMYKTDHHWKTDTGFYVAGLIGEYIAEKTGCRMDPAVWERDNYTWEVYPAWHLGTYGQRTGRFFAGVDDFTLITPDFDTLLQVMPDNVAGSFEDVIIDRSALDARHYESRYTYDRVLAPDNVYEKTVTNLKYENQVSVLMIGDSLARSVNPYLYFAFRKVQMIHNVKSDQVTPEYITNTGCDVVVMMYNPAELIEGSAAFSFAGF